MQLFVIMNSVAIIALVAAVILKIAPVTMLLSLCILPVILKQIGIFLNKQVKKKHLAVLLKYWLSEQ